MTENLIIFNARVVTPLGFSARRGSEMEQLSIIDNATVEVTDGVITYVGPNRGEERDGYYQHYWHYNARGKCLLPGFVDSHTHFVFGGERAEEFSWRLKGESYMSIMERGGGIVSTVKATRACNFIQLRSKAEGFLKQMSAMGVTTVEGKSGYGLDKETIEYALDRNERAHMDYHRENGTVTFIYNVLNLKKDKAYYEAFPMTFIVEHRRLITISNTKNAYVIEQMTRYLESHDTLSIYKFLFASLEIISNAYYPVIEQMDKSKDEVNGLLRQRTTKKNLFALSDLETGMVYLTAAAKQNRMLLEHIQGHALYRSFNEIEREQFDDAMIEAHQLVSMTDLISQVLQQLSASYNNILNNNLNDNLTTLTIISVLLAVLAVVTGFFGMNVPLPLTDEPHAWLYISLASAGLWIVLSLLLRKIAKKS